MTTTQNKKVSFKDIPAAQDATVAQAVNAGQKWTEADFTYLENHMFEDTIESMALALGRTAYSIETQLSKNPRFLELRQKNGDTPEMKIRLKKVEEKQYFVSTDTDVLFGTGD